MDTLTVEDRRCTTSPLLKRGCLEIRGAVGTVTGKVLHSTFCQGKVSSFPFYFPPTASVCFDNVRVCLQEVQAVINEETATTMG